MIVYKGFVMPIALEKPRGSSYLFCEPTRFFSPTSKRDTLWTAPLGIRMGVLVHLSVYLLNTSKVSRPSQTTTRNHYTKKSFSLRDFDHKRPSTQGLDRLAGELLRGIRMQRTRPPYHVALLLIKHKYGPTINYSLTFDILESSNNARNDALTGGKN